LRRTGSQGVALRALPWPFFSTPSA
jgi:hypothetical protein